MAARVIMIKWLHVILISIGCDSASGSNSRLGGYLRSGKLKIDRILGVGGFGTVFKVIYNSNEVKALKIQYVDNADAEKLVKREEAIMKKIGNSEQLLGSHECWYDRKSSTLSGTDLSNVMNMVFSQASTHGLSPSKLSFVKKHKANATSRSSRMRGIHCILTERCLDDLRGYFEKHPIPVDTLLQLMYDCAAGVALLHKKGIIHLDLKHSNVFIYKDASQKLRAKIADFGLALESSEWKNRAGNDTSGTPGFMPPEIFYQAHRGMVVKTTSSDIYALGKIFIFFTKYLGATFQGGYFRFCKTKTAKVFKELHDLARQMTDLYPSKRPSAEQAKEKLSHIIQKVGKDARLVEYNPDGGEAFYLHSGEEYDKWSKRCPYQGKPKPNCHVCPCHPPKPVSGIQKISQPKQPTVAPQKDGETAAAKETATDDPTKDKPPWYRSTWFGCILAAISVLVLTLVLTLCHCSYCCRCGKTAKPQPSPSRRVKVVVHNERPRGFSGFWPQGKPRSRKSSCAPFVRTRRPSNRKF